MKKKLVLIFACLFLVCSAALAAPPAEEVRAENYTGLVVIAKDMNLETNFSPLLFDETGNIVYGDKYIDPDFAIKYGMVEYNSAEAALSGNSRAGAKPLVINALKVTDEDDLVISNIDAQKVLAADAQDGFLTKHAVVYALE